MTETQYKVVFRGETSLGHEVEDVKGKLGTLFKLDGGGLDRLFSGKPIVIKNGVDQQTAVRYKSAIEKAGGICRVGTVENDMTKYPSEEGNTGPGLFTSDKLESVTCPKCGFEQEETEECIKCGIIMSKYKTQEQWAAEERAEPEEHKRDLEFQKDVNSLHAITEDEATDEPLTTDEEASQNEKTWAMLCHLTAYAGYIFPFGNIIGPLIFWLLKRKESSFVDDHGKVSLNFQISMTILAVLSGIMAFAASFTFIGPIIMLAAVVAMIIYQFVMVIIGSVRAHRGDYVNIRLSARFIS